jgi:hypothetical protein
MAVRNNPYNNFVAEAPKVPQRYTKSRSDLRKITSTSPIEEESAARRKKDNPKVPKGQIRPNTNGGYFYHKRQTQLQNRNVISEN